MSRKTLFLSALAASVMAASSSFTVAVAQTASAPATVVIDGVTYVRSDKAAPAKPEAQSVSQTQSTPAAAASVPPAAPQAVTQVPEPIARPADVRPVATAPVRVRRANVRPNRAQRVRVRAIRPAPRVVQRPRATQFAYSPRVAECSVLRCGLLLGVGF